MQKISEPKQDKDQWPASCNPRMPHLMPNATAAAFQPIQVRQADLLVPRKARNKSSALLHLGRFSSLGS